MILRMAANKQYQVFKAVGARGYLTGWTIKQLAMRQAVKLLEEAAKLYLALPFPDSPGFADLTALAWRVKDLAGAMFDNPALWTFRTAEINDQAKKEAADCQVVLMVLSQALSEANGQRFNVVEAAVQKATADIGRGIR